MHYAMFCCSDTTGMQIESGDGSVAVAHKALGSIAFALLLLQVGVCWSLSTVALPAFDALVNQIVMPVVFAPCK